MFDTNNLSPLSNLPAEKPSTPPSPPMPDGAVKHEVYVMPEKFHRGQVKSSSNKSLVIALIILILVVVATATYFLYDMWQKSQNGRLAANVNANVNLETNLANQNLNQENVNDANLNNANLNINLENTSTAASSSSYNLMAPPMISSDSDNDGLTDAEESVIGSSPIAQDSDKDGYIDGQELLKGYSPTAPGGDENGKLPAANFMVALTTSFIKNNFRLLYPTSWQATTIPATNQVVITTNTGEIIKVSVRDNPDQVSAANFYLMANPDVSLSQLKTLATLDNGLSGVFSPNGLEAYLTNQNRNQLYVFQYLMDTNAQFLYPAIFTTIIKNIKPILGSEATANWQTYSNSVYGYSVKYPTDWKTVAGVSENIAGFAPKTMITGYQWSVSVFNSAQKTKEDIISEIGSQYGATRSESRENITIDNGSATKVVVTTTDVPNWHHESIILVQNGKIYQISNGAVTSDAFESFYKSFQFLP